MTHTFVPMDTLKQAQEHLEHAELYYDTSELKDGDAHYRSLSERAYANAIAYAAVAQAEAATRQAAALERIAAALVLLDDSVTQLRTVGLGGFPREMMPILERIAVSLNYANSDR